MTTPSNSFEDLRSILGKLDRKIDRARSQRLGLDHDADARQASPDDGPLIGKAEEPEAGSTDDHETPDNDANASRRRSPYGRAKPLNRGNPNGPGPGWLGA